MSNMTPREHTGSAIRHSPQTLATFAVAVLTAVWPGPATADMGPCKTVAPTTSEAVLLVSDAERSARWYEDNAGLIEQRRWIDPSWGGATLVELRHGRAGLTLVGVPQKTSGFHDPQMVCLVLDGPPAPPSGSKPNYLVDPDGTGVELPAPASQP